MFSVKKTLIRTLIKGLMLVSLISFLSSVQAHTYYEGFTEISVNTVKHRIEVVHNYTTHDLEILLSEKFNQRISADRDNYLKYLKRYIQETFTLSKDGKNLVLTWSGIENGIAETEIYQTVNNVESLLNVKITNKILIGFFPAQVNRTNYNDTSDPKNILSGTLIFKERETVKIIVNN